MGSEQCFFFSVGAIAELKKNAVSVPDVSGTTLVSGASGTGGMFAGGEDMDLVSANQFESGTVAAVLNNDVASGANRRSWMLAISPQNYPS